MLPSHCCKPVPYVNDLSLLFLIAQLRMVVLHEDKNQTVFELCNLLKRTVKDDVFISLCKEILKASSVFKIHFENHSTNLYY